MEKRWLPDEYGKWILNDKNSIYLHLPAYPVGNALKLCQTFFNSVISWPSITLICIIVICLFTYLPDIYLVPVVLQALCKGVGIQR